MKILVCGGRDYMLVRHVNLTLDAMRAWHAKLHGDAKLCIVNGGARGADLLARQWAAQNGVACITIGPAWDYYGKAAGRIRNCWMMKFTTPDAVIAFPGGAGTAHMKQLAIEHKVPVWEF